MGFSLKHFFWLSVFLVFSAFASAEEVRTIGQVAQNITTNSMQGIAKLISAAAYVAGMGFAFASILKFKAHKDNPTQIPMGTPIALLFVAAALIFLPTLFGIFGETVFGSSKKKGGISGDGFEASLGN